MSDFTPEPFHADPQTVMATLDALAQELNWLSRKAIKTERDLEPVEREYQKFVDDYEVGLWRQVEDDDTGKKRLPSEAMRLKLAHAEMKPELLGRYTGLVASRKRLEKRIATVKTAVDAQRSVLSALKTEAEASGAGMRRAA